MALSHSYKKSITEFLTWYNWNRNNTSWKTMPLEQKVNLLDRALHNLVVLIAATADEINGQGGPQPLILPKGVRISGDLRKLG